MVPLNKKILLVEDNPINQKLTTLILRRKGYVADIAENGQAGLDLYKKNTYEVILMDIQMPVLDGIKTAQLIRQFESNNHTKRSTIIAVTAYGRDNIKEAVFNAGMDFYLDKPFDVDELFTLINAAS